MDAYPEFIGIDATYKLLDLRTPVYVIHNEDSNGATVVVCVAILVTEDEASLKWLLEKFKQLNPMWTKTKCIMADKDLFERKVLNKCFPQAQVLICVSHAEDVQARDTVHENGAHILATWPCTSTTSENGACKVRPSPPLKRCLSQQRPPSCQTLSCFSLFFGGSCRQRRWRLTLSNHASPRPTRPAVVATLLSVA